jgi:hypothetical protein
MAPSMELNVGILATSLPPLRPLFATILKASTTVIKSSALQVRHGYYLHDKSRGVELESLPSKQDVCKEARRGNDEV